ncbi:AMP-binding protein [Alicyclobacillus tolerans]|uniref:AMP-binding protein n=1 Tax=Alicyclobacillus tolerans TaxID=90970 RepID=UPI001F460B5E|nr:AMP-binding protein [Alicyclobacillus tolerans]MCF8568436.1 AMP-binding protein [Alicyclobacillus tolerans]
MDIIGNRTLPLLLDEKASLYPDKVFLWFEDKDGNTTSLTYAQFVRKVNQLGNAMLRLGVQNGDKVTLHLTNSVEFMLSWFALAKVGAVMVPTNVLSTAQEMEYILGHSESVLLITEQEHTSKFAHCRNHLPKLREVLVARCASPSPGSKSLNELMEALNSSR